MGERQYYGSAEQDWYRQRMMMQSSAHIIPPSYTRTGVDIGAEFARKEMEAQKKREEEEEELIYLIS